ncbi:MAG: TonB-dependent receptor [Salibacteraceae bacterium]|nr:TonB-dependent receptor [Salibacteraceae bacterium]
MKEFSRAILFSCFWLISMLGNAQTLVHKADNGFSLQDFSAKNELLFLFENEDYKGVKLIVINDSTPLLEALNQSLKAIEAHAFFKEPNYVLITKNKIESNLPVELFETQENVVIEPKEKASNYLKTNRQVGIKTVVIGNKKDGAYQSTVNITGNVKNRISGEPIFGVTIYIDETKGGTITDFDGNYSLKLPKGTYHISTKSLEYEELKYILKVYSDGQLDFTLNSKVYDLGEVIVRADAVANVERPAMGLEKLTTKTLKTIPKVMGETDIVKVALLLPGVQSVGEGTGGFNVRGAPADQNIFYLNQIPVYNTSHLMGFFSSFTPNAIGEFSLYKSSFPANYGGRLSSVFDIQTKEGRKDGFMLRGGISPITTDALVEGSLNKKKLTYLLGIRTTYSDWVLNLINVPAFENSSGKFRDGILQLNYDLNKNNQLKFTSYYSYDRINLNGLTDFNYQNLGGSLSWKKIIKNKHQFELSTVSSNYQYNEQNTVTDFQDYDLRYALNHHEAKANLTLRPNHKHTILIGANTVLYQLDLGELNPIGNESVIQSLDFGAEKGLESGIYINEEWKLNGRISLNGGVRLNSYQYLGPQTTFTYQDGAERSIDNITDTTFYGANKVIASYFNPDVRFSAKFAIDEFFSLKGSVNQVHQYINMLSNTVALAPNAKWKLADHHVKPMQGWQYSVGAFKNLKQNKYELSLELYYKKVTQLVEFKDGANLVVSTLPETELLQGELNAYGGELMLKKSSGKLTGWINYTYARSLVQVQGINYGEIYPANYDKPHALNVVANYKFSRRINVSSNMVFASGRPITYPTAVFYQTDFPNTFYSTRNEFRIPNYLRFDASMSYEGNLKKDKPIHGIWNVSVYNLLGRNNAFTVYALQEGSSINGYQLSIFGSPIVSVAYQFKLGSYEQ